MINLLKDIEWRRHSIGLALFSVAFVFFIVTCFFYFDEQATLSDYVNRSHQQQAINFSADESRRQLGNYLGQYSLEQDRGVIGPAQRLQWVEVTQGLSDKYRIPLIEYTLNSAEKIDELNSPYWHPELSIEMADMNLDMELYHEGDFFRVMNALAREAKGLFSVERCTLSRKPYSEGEDPAFAGFNGRCALRWYSMKDITASWQRVE